MNSAFIRRAERRALRAALLEITVLGCFAIVLLFAAHPVLGTVFLVLSISFVWTRHIDRMDAITERIQWLRTRH